MLLVSTGAFTADPATALARADAILYREGQDCGNAARRRP